MRIIAGKFKGRRINLPVELEIRPTSEKVRAAIFSSLLSVVDLTDCAILDLYAGSGALGIEAISRGGSSVEFVENNHQVANTLKSNLKKLELENIALVTVNSVENWLKSIRKKNSHQKPFDIIFVDPPYEDHPGNQLVEFILATGKIREGSYIVVESSSMLRFPPIISSQEASLSAELFREKKYGDTQICIYVAKRSL